MFLFIPLISLTTSLLTQLMFCDTLFGQSFLPFLTANQSSCRYDIILRSIFLQGILLSRNFSSLPNNFSHRFVTHANKYFQFLDEINQTPLQYALGTALSVNPSEVIVGVINKSQLDDISSAYRDVVSSVDLSTYYTNDFSFDNPSDYDPRNCKPTKPTPFMV